MHGPISGAHTCAVREMTKRVNFMFGILGGSDPKFHKESPKALASCFCFDPHTMEWTNIAPMRTPRLMHSLVALSGRLYAIGGQDINDR